jgi:hypothetical protein
LQTQRAGGHPCHKRRLSELTGVSSTLLVGKDAEFSVPVFREVKHAEVLPVIADAGLIVFDGEVRDPRRASLEAHTSLLERHSVHDHLRHVRVGHVTE